MKERRRVPLEEAPVFSGMSPQQKREIEMAGTRRIVGKARFLFKEGDPAHGLHVLLSGRLKSSRFLAGGHEVVLHFIEPGQLFGEIPAFLGKAYPAAAQASEQSEVFTLPMPALERLIARQPEIALRIFRGMAIKLNTLLDRIESQKGLHAEERLARYIVSRSEPTGLKRNTEFSLPINKKTLAAELGMQPESLSRSFRRLSEAGVIRVRGRNIALLAPEQLIQLAGGVRNG
jgi:CRP/FNR family transcriptional regulator, dissimilatory nitrate respiration regulator